MDSTADQAERQTHTAQLVVIVNANARMGGDACLADAQLGASLRARGLQGRVQPTESEEDCVRQIARAAREGAEVIVAAGGDGTVRSVIEGLIRVRDGRPALGILACGTMNNIAGAFGIPEDINAGLDLIAECIERGRYFPFDIGMIGDEPFVEVAGVGLMAQLFPLAEDLKSNGLRASADIVEGVRDIMTAKPAHVRMTLDGRRVDTRALQVTICNTPSHGARILLAPQARIDDGLLDVVVDDRVSGARMLWDLLTSLDPRLLTRQRRRMYQAHNVRITQETPWTLQMDGAYKGEYGPGAKRRFIEAHAEKGALRVCAAERPPKGGAIEPESALQTFARLLPTSAAAPATTTAVSAGASADASEQSAAPSATTATTATTAAHDIAAGVARGAEGVAQNVAQGVTEQVERRLASPEHAAQMLKRLRWAYAPGIALGLAAAVAVRRRELLPGDLEALQAIQRLHSPLMDRVMTTIAAPGFPPLSVELIGVGALALWLARLRLEAAFLLASATGVTLLDTSLKGLIQRKRPEDPVARVLRLIAAPSFPSGHVMNYVSVFGFLGAASMANVKPSLTRTLLTSACGGMAALIGPARVYLGAHWPSDTAAGYLFGALYLGGLLEVYTFAKQRQAQKRRRERKATGS